MTFHPVCQYEYYSLNSSEQQYVCSIGFFKNELGTPPMERPRAGKSEKMESRNFESCQLFLQSQHKFSPSSSSHDQHSHWTTSKLVVMVMRMRFFWKTDICYFAVGKAAALARRCLACAWGGHLTLAKSSPPRKHPLPNLCILPAQSFFPIIFCQPWRSTGLFWRVPPVH